ncbi:MutS-related protein [Tsukamurella soli]|uniref:DNA mismatch repair protein MutS n=1 Tax=Tsukamurella soli TaxID=644556 RepID=A0ABP8K5C1_9ACTN
MRTRLLSPQRDLTDLPALPPRSEELRRDLGLEPLLAAMADGDDDVYRVAERMLLGATATAAEIRHRHAVLRDCIAHPAEVAELRRIAVDAVEQERRNYFGLFTRATPEKVLYRSLDVLDMFVEVFARLRTTCARYAPLFRSAGLRAFLAEVATELDDAYLTEVRAHLRELRFARGELVSARLGMGNHGTDYTLRRAGPVGRRGWPHREPGGVGFDVTEVDGPGGEDLAALAGRGVRTAADSLAQATDHVARYFQTIADELGFYLGTVALLTALTERGGAWCLPEPIELQEDPPGFAADGLYDPTLLLGGRGPDASVGPAVGSTVDATGRSLVVVTGANGGGKTTFLRSVGIAQLMLRCGMFVPARAYRGGVFPRVFTHSAPREDPAAGGRLEDELARMSAIADHIRPGDLILLGESMASTNEQEGAVLAREVVTALQDAGVTVVYVTHMFTLADGFHRRGDPRDAFLRAERLGDGTRTFAMVPGRPLATSYGIDLYRSVIGEPSPT